MKNCLAKDISKKVNITFAKKKDVNQNSIFYEFFKISEKSRSFNL